MIGLPARRKRAKARSDPNRMLQRTYRAISSTRSQNAKRAHFAKNVVANVSSAGVSTIFPFTSNGHTNGWAFICCISLADMALIG